MSINNQNFQINLDIKKILIIKRLFFNILNGLDIITRDKMDSERDAAPLTMARDALVLDTTNMTIEESVVFIVDSAKKRHII